MAFTLLIIIFVVSIVILLIYNSYTFQIFKHRRKLKKIFLDDFTRQVKGSFVGNGYFAVSHRVVQPSEYKSYSNRHKANFSFCYNVVTFKTPDAHWELFFHLIKDNLRFSEIMTVRTFPIDCKIKSEGNVEKSYSRLNILTNNRYLTGILESPDTKDYLKWLLRENGDILLISHNNLHFKAFLKNDKMSTMRVMDMIKAMNIIKNKIYKKDVIEY